ncbi:MAG: MFS transporter, partial [Gammaproteobacteria bacterium]
MPLAIVALAIAWLRVPESRGVSATGGLDAWGALLATVALGGIVYAFIKAPIRGSPAVLAALLVGVAAAMVFVVVELRARSPMLPLQL